MPFALPIQILLAQIGMPALQHESQETQFILFVQSRHSSRRRAHAALLKENNPRPFATFFRYAPTGPQRFLWWQPCRLQCRWKSRRHRCHDKPESQNKDVRESRTATREMLCPQS
jgi:hypothetical protein